MMSGNTWDGAVKFKIQDWGDILLDTGVVLLICQHIAGISDDRGEFAYNLVRTLSRDKTSAGKERTFFISTVTLSEIQSTTTDAALVKRIVDAINSENVEFVSFDETVAFTLRAGLHPLVASRKAANDLATKFGFPVADFKMAREWIQRDAMILECGKSRNIDVALTIDRKSFVPMGAQMQVRCAIVEQEHYGLSGGGDSIFTYQLKNKVEAG